MVDMENVQWWHQEYSKMINEYLEDKKKGVRHTGKPASENSLKIYKGNLRRFERKLGKHLEEATTDEIEEAAIQMKDDDLSAATYNSTLVAVRGFYRWALRHHADEFAATEMPLDGISASKPRTKHEHASIDERGFKRLIATIEDLEEDRKEDAIASERRGANMPWVQDELRVWKKTLPLKLMYYGGLRISEAVNLKTEFVDIDGVTIHGKGDKYRFVPLPAEIMDELHEFIKEAEPQEYVFEAPSWSRRSAEGVPVTTLSVNQAFTAARDALGWSEDLKPHSLRHSFANHAKNRVSLDVLQDLMGHENILTTRQYITNNNDAIKREAKKIWN